MKLILDWKTLQEISASPVVTSSGIWIVIAPIAARLLSNLQKTINITIGDVGIPLQISLPFSWEALFFAALAFQAANLCRRIFCPKIIKESKNFRDYLSQSKSVQELIEALDTVKNSRQCKSLDPQSDEAVKISNTGGAFTAAYIKLQMNAQGNNSITGIINPEMLNPTLSEGYYLIEKYLNQEKIPARFVATIFNYVGFLLIGLVLYQSTSSVVRMML